MNWYQEFKRDLPWIIVGIFAAAAVSEWFHWGFDSTDGRVRSGLGLYTDAATGCQYLSAGLSGITPRLDRNGKQICGVTP